VIHLGDRKTLTTACGKPVARRWWQEKEHLEGGKLGPLTVARVVKPDLVDCPACLKEVKR
jgi:hypothetical protein